VSRESGEEKEMPKKKKHAKGKRCQWKGLSREGREGNKFPREKDAKKFDANEWLGNQVLSDSYPHGNFASRLARALLA